MSNELIPIQQPDLPALFSPGGLSDLLDRIEADAKAIVPDTSTAKGRKAIASVAAKVASSKVYIDGLGKDFVAGLKAQAAVVDAERKIARDRLDRLKAEVRQPLTDWEEAELARVRRHQVAIETLKACSAGIDGLSSAQIVDRIEEAGETYQVHGDWDEFESAADAAHAETIRALTEALERAKHREAEQAELARLRAESIEREKREAVERAAREQKEREERIAREAEERAKAQAEAAAKAEAEKAERARIAAEQARQAEIERANQERIDAERRAAQAEERARMAAEQERARADAEAAAKQADDDLRAADVEHRRAVNSKAVSALIDAGIAQSVARDVITAIARGDIPNVTIRY